MALRRLSSAVLATAAQQQQHVMTAIHQKVGGAHVRAFASGAARLHQVNEKSTGATGSAAATGDEAGEKTTHFGFTTVPEHEKQKMVGHVFHSVASKYDVMNDVMSVGIHRLWKDRFIQVMNPFPGTKLLDVAGGTGDISFRFLEHARRNGQGDLKDTVAIVCDINSSMLEQGKARSATDSIPDHLSWVVGNAEQLPLDDNSIDCYTIAFGIRNVTHIDKALQEAFRVLRPGGRFLCLEFSQVDNPVFRKIYDTYSFEAIPILGEIFAGDMASYKYLVESIRQFPNQTKFAGMIRNAGFRNVTYENLTLGIAAIHSGFKIV